MSPMEFEPKTPTDVSNLETPDPPEWLMKMVREAMDLFGIHSPEWRVGVTMTKVPGGCEDAFGFVTTDNVYMNADIQFAIDLQEDEIYRSLVYHEVMHIQHQVVDSLVNQMLELLPSKISDIMKANYESATEQFIQKLTRAICYKLRKDHDDA